MRKERERQKKENWNGKGTDSEIRIGTSGYSYPWNEGKPTPFAWYLSQGFKTVEINASFYRFPSPSWIKAWKIAPEGFDFTIKVHRSITHYARMHGNALNLFAKFRATLSEIEEKISFWLFQMPSTFLATKENIEVARRFLAQISLGNKVVIEFRHSSWWKHTDEIERTGAVFCSVDAPELPRDIISMNDVVYLRLHGRESWYSFIYTEGQLRKIATELISIGAKKKYVLLNNDHGMIPNGKFLIQATST